MDCLTKIHLCGSYDCGPFEHRMAFFELLDLVCAPIVEVKAFNAYRKWYNYHMSYNTVAIITLMVGRFAIPSDVY